MPNSPFPDSEQKNHLRLYHLENTLPELRRDLGHDLNYFGLTSANMTDIKRWRFFIDKIVAVENDRRVADLIFRTASSLQVRARTTVIERDLELVCQIMAEGDDSAQDILAGAELDRLKTIKSTPYHIINLDFCSGFVFPRHDNTSSGTRSISNLISYQSKYEDPFVMLLTFATRDSGADDYDMFIESTLNAIGEAGFETSKLRRFYLATNPRSVPPQLRRLKFCVPVWIHKKGFERYHVSTIGTWYYKTFYHTAIRFRPRLNSGVLGASTWPPVDEMKGLLDGPIVKIFTDGDTGRVLVDEIEVPSISKHGGSHA